MNVRIKICGITSEADAAAAARAGADAVGLNFHPESPRAIDVTQAQAICAVLPPFVTTVGLFVDAPADRIADILEQVPLQMLQFHGDEPEADCTRWNRPWLKALRMRDDLDLAALATSYGAACALLLDSYRPGVPGGTGEAFDWRRIPPALPRPLVLAGGLTPENVGEAIRIVRPQAVDVSGGVERAKGVKDAEAMQAFVDAVRRADRPARAEAAMEQAGNEQ